MLKKLLCCVPLFLLCFSQAVFSQDIRQYEVNKTADIIVPDGILSEGACAALRKRKNL